MVAPSLREQRMKLEADQLKYMEIFLPEQLQRSLEVAQKGRRFVYYTSADTAMKIIKNEELWLRNATVMNDFYEIRYGLDLIYQVFHGPTGARFKEAVDEIHAGTIERVNHLLDGWQHDWEYETYISCVSLHRTEEDSRGRLSMWRAYGDTALVVNNTPMLQVTDDLGVFSAPVAYLSRERFESKLNDLTDRILINRTYLRDLGQDIFVGYIHHFLFLTSIATKHPGFEEEQEWRIFYRPTERKSSILKEHQVVLGGVPQTVFALPLKHDPENGLHHADIPSLLDRIIIGPTNFPHVSQQAFRKVLEVQHGITDGGRVVASDIPLRIN